MDAYGRAVPISGDEPIDGPEQDQLGYAPFARNLARCVTRMSAPHGFSAALFGAWGSGKTSVLNMVKHYATQYPEAQRPIVVEFNPWWIAGREELALGFLRQLEHALRSSKPHRGIRSAGAWVTESVLGRISRLDSELMPAGVRLASLVAKLAQPASPDVVRTKEAISRRLQGGELRILVLIDDIDRLTPDEICQVFQAVKAVANFPNVIYLMACDREVVVKALREKHGTVGDDYIEKIVQVPFALPLPERSSLVGMLSKQLEAILVGAPEGAFRTPHFYEVFAGGIDHFLRTPRDVTRFANVIAATYPAAAGEVDLPDLLGIEALKLFVPEAYDVVRGDPDAFTGIYHLDVRTSMEPARAFHAQWLSEVPVEHQGATKQLVSALFPKLQGIWASTIYTHDSAVQWRKGRRICSSDAFPVYFRLAIPEGTVSLREVQRLLADAGDQVLFEARLTELAQQRLPDGTTRARRALGRLHDHVEDFQIGDIGAVISALLNVTDALTAAEQPVELLDFGADWSARALLEALLARLSVDDRYRVLADGINTTDSLLFVTRELHVLTGGEAQEPGAVPSSKTEFVVSREHLAQLRHLVADRIAESAKRSALLSRGHAAVLLAAWSEWGNSGDAKEWVGTTLRTQDGLAALLLSFVVTKRTQTAGDPTVRSAPYLDPDALRPYVDPAELLHRVTELVDDTTRTQEARDAARLFLCGYRARAAGGDPSDPLDEHTRA